MTIHTDPTKRHDFVLLFDVQDGNPNGDPDAGNLPRLDPETMHGLVTDVCIKRKVRNFVDLTHGHEEHNKIYVQEGVALNIQHNRAYTALGIESTGTRQEREDVDKVRQWMCDNFYDIRMFGAVMTTGVNCGQVRGPLQLTFARSISAIVPLDLSITRVAVTREEDAKVVVDEEREVEGAGKRTAMGRKPILPYGLYRGHGFFSPQYAIKTQVTPEDLELFWTALQNAWELDRSSSRGMMACRGLYVFTHANPLGNAHAHDLFDRVQVTPKDEEKSARAFSDYQVAVNDTSLPEGVTLTRLVG
jgi:CRISPR-associated protein Csd2